MLLNPGRDNRSGLMLIIFGHMVFIYLVIQFWSNGIHTHTHTHTSEKGERERERERDQDGYDGRPVENVRMVNINQ